MMVVHHFSTIFYYFILVYFDDRLSDVLSRDAGLLFSVTTEEIVNMENNIVAAFSWLLHFGNRYG